MKIILKITLVTILINASVDAYANTYVHPIIQRYYDGNATGQNYYFLINKQAKVGLPPNFQSILEKLRDSIENSKSLPEDKRKIFLFDMTALVIEPRNRKTNEDMKLLDEFKANCSVLPISLVKGHKLYGEAYLMAKELYEKSNFNSKYFSLCTIVEKNDHWQKFMNFPEDGSQLTVTHNDFSGDKYALVMYKNGIFIFFYNDDKWPLKEAPKFEKLK